MQPSNDENRLRKLRNERLNMLKRLYFGKNVGNSKIQLLAINEGKIKWGYNR